MREPVTATVRLLKHPNGCFELQYKTKFLGISFWVNAGERMYGPDGYDRAVAAAERLREIRELKTKVVRYF